MYITVSNCFLNKLPNTYLLKLTQIYFLTVLKFRNLKWIHRVAFLPEALGGKSVYLPFLASAGCSHFLAYGSSPPSSKREMLGWDLLTLESLWCSLLPPSSTYKNPGDVIGPSWGSQDHLPPHVKVSWLAAWVPSATWFLLYHVTKYSQVPGIWIWTSLGKGDFLHTTLSYWFSLQLYKVGRENLLILWALRSELTCPGSHGSLRQEWFQIEYLQLLILYSFSSTFRKVGEK